MKRALFPVLAALACVALAADKLTAAQVLKDAEKYDGKILTVVGKIAKFEQKTSKIGNKYFTFEIKEGDAVVNGYGRGECKPPLKEGDKVEAIGKFAKTKTVKDFIVKNEIDVSPVKDKPNGVKKVD